jgi:uncharacterized protein (TIGR02285 family)
MNGRSRRSAAIASSCLALLASMDIARADEAPATVPREIVWNFTDLKPSAILSGPKTGEGYSQKVVAWFEARMPEFNHRIETLPLARALAMMKDGDDLCTNQLLRTPERSAYIAYSKPLFAILPIRLFVAPSFADRVRAMAGDRPIDLKQLAKSFPGLAIPRVISRSYGARIDADLAEVSTQTIPGQGNAISMFASNHADVIIAYPEELSWYEAISTGQVAYESFALEGPELYDGIIACTRNPWGQAVIARVDALAAAAPPGMFQDFYRDWLDPPSKQALAALMAASRPH